MTDRAYLILNMADHHAGAWPNAFGEQSRIPADERPTVLHTTRESAERELLRLACSYPRGNFVLFEAAAVGVHQTVPTHITLGGQIVATRAGAYVAKLGEDLPF